MSPTQYIFDLAPMPSLKMEDFVISGNNREAHGWVTSWPHWPSYGVIMFGPKGSGKTHLARLWQDRSKAVTITPQQLGQGDSASLLQGARHALLENVDANIAAEPLFHLFNHLQQARGTLLMTSRSNPARWNLLLDAQSRLNALPAVAIDEPDDALLTALMRKLFSDRQLKVSDEVIDYLLPRMERSFRAAGELVQKLDHAALAQKRDITLPLARQILESAS